MNRANNIPIVMSVDNTYIFPTCVTIWTMIRNKRRDTIYRFFFLSDEKLSRESRDTLEKLRRLSGEFYYTILTVEQELFKNAPVTTGHLSCAAYYRLAIAGMLDGYDKCIYIDGDTIVNTDLQELWETDIGDNYIAGVKNWGFQTQARGMEAHRKAGGLLYMDQYINSGVLLMNLKQIRQDGMEERFLQNVPVGYISEDQDILNICCYGRIYFLPLKYNLYNRYLGKTAYLTGNIYSEREKEEAGKHPAIIHFAGGITKPWNNTRCIWSDVWWRYARELSALFPCEKLWESANRISTQRDYEAFLHRIGEEKEIVLFGDTKDGRRLFKALRVSGSLSDIYVCDNDIHKQGREEDGIRVRAAEEIFPEKSSALFINMARRSRDEVEGQLRSLGVKENRIISYYDILNIKSKVYYTALKKDYYDLELKQIFLTEGGAAQEYDPDTWRKKLQENSGESRRIREQYSLDYWLMEAGQIV